MKQTFEYKNVFFHNQSAKNTNASTMNKGVKEIHDHINFINLLIYHLFEIDWLNP